VTEENLHPLSSTESGEYVTTRAGGRVFVKVVGAGPPIVWVAGLGDDHEGWAAQVADFSADYTCVTFDNRGVGRSTVLPGPYSMSDFADDAHDVLASLGLGPAIAIGSSMGGAICQRWALDYPADLTHLVLSSTWAERDAYLSLLLRHWVALIESQQPQRLAESLFLGCYSGSYLRQHAEIIDEFLATPLPDLEGLKASVQACLGHEALEELATVEIPTLVVSGTLDIVARVELSERIAEHLPNGSLQTIKSGHMIIWEKPDAFASVVRDYLNAG